MWLRKVIGSMQSSYSTPCDIIPRCRTFSEAAHVPVFSTFIPLEGKSRDSE
jgi:hypothetical protein